MGISLAITQTHPVHKIGRLVLIAMVSYTSAQADVIVNPAQPITHRVKIQPIIASDGAGQIATFMGDAEHEAYIKEQINLIWAQHGIEIEWLPKNIYHDAFTYDGSPANYTSIPRPASHLDLIVNGSPSPPINEDENVYNMFFVNIVPYFKKLPEYNVAGYAYIDGNGGNGCVIFTGETLVSLPLTPIYQEYINFVINNIAHEIGHGLGLFHVTNSNNLLNTGSIDEPRLDGPQQTVVFTDDPGIDGYDFLQELSNYEIWADGFSITGTPDDDDDFDNLSNGFEFLYGSPPNLFTQFPSATHSSLGLTWTFNKQAEAVSDGFEYVIETGPALNDWYAAGTTGSGSTIISDTPSELSVRLDFGNSRSFLRANATAAVAPVAAAIPVSNGEIVEAAAHTNCICARQNGPVRIPKEFRKPTAD